MYNCESPQRTGSQCDDNDHVLQSMYDNMTDYERGEFDYIHGYEALDNSAEYERGYGDAYAAAECATFKTIQQMLGE